jgi:Flp pilus assembly protein CpaB
MPAPSSAAAFARHLQRLPRRLRIALTTKPLAYWTATLLVASAVAYAVYGVVVSAEAARSAYGASAPVLVARHDIEPGTALDETNTEVRELPLALVADGVLHALPAETTVSAALMAGEPVHRQRVGRAGEGPVASVLPDGTSGLAIPRDETSLPLQPGDRVDVVAAVTTVGGATARVVTAGATVAFVAERAVVVAIPAEHLTDAAQALTDGGVVLALSASR